MPFHYWDKGTMATIGRNKAVADLNFVRFGGFLAWIMWAGVHIFFLVGFRNRFAVIGEWAWNYFSFYRGSRLITGTQDGQDALRYPQPGSAPMASPDAVQSAARGVQAVAESASSCRASFDWACAAGFDRGAPFSPRIGTERRDGRSTIIRCSTFEGPASGLHRGAGHDVGLVCDLSGTLRATSL